MIVNDGFERFIDAKLLNQYHLMAGSRYFIDC